MKASATARLATIDALRGIAAFLVVLFHIRGALGDNLKSWMPDWIYSFLSYGFVGVAVFFVISGFVIALSLSHKRATLGLTGRFAIRRSLRLDPPYWVAIALEIGLIYLALQLFPETVKSVPPTWDKVVAHIFYMQDILEYGNIAAVFWTLCIELQFYLFYALMLTLVQWRSAEFIDENGNFSKTASVWFGLSALLGIACMNKLITPPFPGLFIAYWPYFLSGALIALSYASRLSPKYFIGHTILLVISAVFKPTPYLVAALITIIFLFYVASRNLFSSMLSFRPLIYLGTISYSLYLFHSIVGWRFVILVQTLHKGPLSPTMSITVFFCAVIVSLISADIAFRIIETPSINLAKKIRY
ncbi:predicted acyltransferase [gamma proteobacterium HdN1]|nr:predicted acyltransferase [gamma proteobacterium HdN1]